jgi:uncharacterized protein
MDSGPLTGTMAPSGAAFPPFLTRAPWWGGDLQTLRNFLIRRPPPITAYPVERLMLAMRDGSGDRLVAALNTPPEVEASRPLVVLVHGLGGSEQSLYILHTATYLLSLGFRVLRLNLRGAGPSRPFCRFQYHAGRTGDFADALAALPREVSSAGLVGVGFSLGANMLLKFLGERGGKVPLKAAVSVSAPLDLALTARQLMRWRNVVYQGYLLRDMRRDSLGPGAEVTAAERAAILEARSIWEFDHRFSAPRDGIASAEDYYERHAAKRFLDGIGVPTLVIHALDDPWIPPAPYLAYDWRRNPKLVPLLAPSGGHVGFQGKGRAPWHDLCIARFLEAV